MLKRFTARLLILLQIYNSVFQGVAHANLAERYPIADEVYLHSSFSGGGVKLALGTNGNAADLSIDHPGAPKMLEMFDVPSYEFLRSLDSSQYSKSTYSQPISPSSLSSSPPPSPLSPPGPLTTEETTPSDLHENIGFEQGGITRTKDGTHFNLQGLDIFINNLGQTLVQGKQTDFSKPIFLSSEGEIILRNVTASSLQVTSPNISLTGISVIDCFAAEGGAPESLFSNHGNLTAKQLFLKGLKSSNSGSITAPNVWVDGALESTGELTSKELILEESTFLKLTEGSRASIKSLFLSKSSQLENHTTTTIDVLDSLGGTFSNFGILDVGEVAVDSAFQAIHNRHLLSVERGDIKASKLENAGTFIAEASDLQVISGRSVQALKVKTLVVSDEFTNETAGSFAAEAISGTGHFHNLGRIETDTQLDVGVKRLTNYGAIKAQRVVGLPGLEKITNTSDASITATTSLNFADSTQVVNEGILKASDIALRADSTTQTGTISAKNLQLTGATFLNQGDIEVEEVTTLNIEKLVNRGSLKIQRIDFGGGRRLRCLENAKGGVLSLKEDINVEGHVTEGLEELIINDGALKARFLNFSTAQLTQRGKIEARYFRTSSSMPFTNHGEIKTEHLVVDEKKRVENHVKHKFKKGIQASLESLISLGVPVRRVFENYGKIEVSKCLEVDVERLINHGTIDTAKIVLDDSHLSHLENAKGAAIFLRERGRLLIRGNIINDGLISGDAYEFLGKSLVQRGVIRGTSLKTCSRVTTADGQEIELANEFEMHGFIDDLHVCGRINANSFSGYNARVDLHGHFNVKKLFRCASITIHKDASLKASYAILSGEVNGTLEVDDTLETGTRFTVNGTVQVRRNALLQRNEFIQVDHDSYVWGNYGNSGLETIYVSETGVLKGYPGNTLSLYVGENIGIAGLVEADNLKATQYVSLREKGKLISRNSTKLRESVHVSGEAEAILHGLKIYGGVIYNHGGKIQVFKQEQQGSTPTIIVNSGSFYCDAAQNLQSEDVPPIRMLFTNRTKGHFTLKGGTFDVTQDLKYLGIEHAWIGCRWFDTGTKKISISKEEGPHYVGFDNRGTLVQDGAILRWTEPKNTGIWQVTGALTIPSYTGYELGDLRVDDALHVKTSQDSLIALDALAKVKARRVILQAPHLRKLPQTAERASRTYPWPLEMLLEGDFDGNVDVSAPLLKIHSQNLKTSGNLASQAPLEITVVNAAEVSALLGGQEGLTLQARRLKILAKFKIPGAAAPAIFYKGNGNGLYSSEGPVVLRVTELIDNSYGTIQGTSYSITGQKPDESCPELINTAGLISATDPALGSEMRVTTIRNKRDIEQGSTPIYRCPGHPSMRISAANRNNHSQLGWCSSPCTHVGNNYHETSDQAVITAKGHLLLTYTTLDMLVSRITSGGNLTLETPGVSRSYTSGAPITDAPSTTMPPRNGQVSQILAKYDFKADLGVVDASVAVTAQNVSIRALAMTLQSLGIQVQQADQVVDLLGLMSGSGANAYRAITDASGANQHFDLALPIYRQQELPAPLVIVGKGARQQALRMDTINTQATMRAYIHSMGLQFATVYRGISALGLDESHIFKLTSDFVRAQKGTTSHKRLLKSGGQVQEIEVLANEEITQQDVLDTGLPAVFLEFAKNIDALEASKKAQEAVERAAEASASLFFGIPKANPDGIKAIDKVELRTTQGDLGLFVSVKATDGLIVAEQGSITIGSTVVRQQGWENYQDALIRTSIEMERTLRIHGFKDVIFEAAITRSGVRTAIASETGMVADRAVATTSYRVDHYHSKDESSTVRTTHVHQNVCEHSAGVEAVITSPLGILQEASKLTNPVLRAPVIIQDDVHDQHMVEVETVSHKKAGFFGGLLGIKERKTTTSTSVSAISRGCYNAGAMFRATAMERFRSVASTFAAKRSDITAPRVELVAGVSQSQSQEVSTFKGAVWNKTRIHTEKHKTHTSPVFANPVYIHSPDVIVERVRGSGLLPHLHSDAPVTYHDVDDVHEEKTVRQKSLSAGAALLLKLAATLITGNPFTGAGVGSVMLSAGYATLCGEAALCLVEQDGNPGRAIDELGRRHIIQTVGMSMATAGLTKAAGGLAGVTNSTAMGNLAKRELIRSAVRTTLAVSLEGKEFGDAFKQGITSAAINTVAAWGASRIGDLYKPDEAVDTKDAPSSSAAAEPISSAAHKALHFGLGSALGATTAAITGQDITRSAVSGGVGAVLGESFAEAFDSKALGDFLATAAAFATGLESDIAYLASANATEYNYDAHHRLCLQELGLDVGEDGAEEEAAGGKDEDKTAKHKATERRLARNRDKVRRALTRTTSPTRTGTLG